MTSRPGRDATQKTKKKQKNWKTFFCHNIKSDVKRFNKNCYQCHKQDKIKKVMRQISVDI